MSDPVVSVKMITYNQAPYIAEAIEGVLRQKTIFPFELVIGEDCSTDGTREIVFDYKKKYPQIIVVVTSDKNVGSSGNSYRTLKACRGKYVAICEGDDYWHFPYKIQKQVDYMGSHPECGLLLTDADKYYQKNNKILSRSNFKNGFQKRTNLTIEQLIRIEGEMTKFTCTAMVRRHLCDKVTEEDPYLYQSGEFLMGDTQLWAELSLIGKVTYIPDSTATYRVLDESASKSKDRQKLCRFWKSVYEMQLYLCEKHKLSEDIRKNAASQWNDYSLELAFFERNFNLAKEVKKRKHRLTIKEWGRFLGAKYLIVNYGYRSMIFLRKFYRNNRSD